MHTENLIAMANQIEAFFNAEGDAEIAISGIHDHIARFWEPRMRRLIIAHAASGGEGLGEHALAAVRRLAPPKAA